MQRELRGFRRYCRPCFVRAELKLPGTHRICAAQRRRLHRRHFKVVLFTKDGDSLRQNSRKTAISRRDLFRAAGKAAGASVALSPLVQSAILGSGETAMDSPVVGSAGVDRINVLGSRTYLHGWAGYGEPPVLGRPQGQQPAQLSYTGQARQADAAPAPAGPASSGVWTKESGPGTVTFADPHALITTATFSALGSYVLKLTVTNGESSHSSTLHVSVQAAPPQTTRSRLHQELQNLEPVLERPREGSDRQLDPALHRPDQSSGSDCRAGRDRQLHQRRQSAARRTPRVSQGLRVLECLGTSDRRGDEHRADGRSAGRPDIIKAHEKFRKTLDEVDPDCPGRTGT